SGAAAPSDSGMSSPAVSPDGAGSIGDAGGGGLEQDASSGDGASGNAGPSDGALDSISEAASEAASSAGATDASGHAITPGGYYVAGNAIYDASGRVHVFHGVDRTSFEWNAQGQYVAAGDYGLMAGWKANVVRIPLDQDFWLTGSPIYDAGYAGVIDQQVTSARAAGLDVILDLHWSDKGLTSTASASTLGTLPGQQRMADASSVAFWRDVASRYKDDGHVFFELYNEPHDISWDVWQNGGDTGASGAGGAAFTAAGMQSLYDTVRAAGADNLVLIGGVDWAYDLSGVPAHRIRGYNIVYVSHVYHHNSGHDAADWPASWGFLTATDPVMMTEFGPFSNQGSEVNCGLDFVTSLLDYADSKSVSWSSWAWWVYTAAGTDNGSDYCDYPSILLSRDGTPNSLGQIVKARLATY
ncbi:MAG: glycoside hydrolase family 5 protein, partial [Polyangiaceae bacterium]